MNKTAGGMTMRQRVSVLFCSAIPLMVLGLASPELARMASGVPRSGSSQGDSGEVRTPDEVLEGVSFARDRKVLFVPLRELSQAFELKVAWDHRRQAVFIENLRVPERHVRRLLDGTLLVALNCLGSYGIERDTSPDGSEVWLEDGERQVLVRKPEKRVVVNLKTQHLRAWEGKRLVLTTRVSTGRKGFETPEGEFEAGPLKARMLISRKYDDAEMPWTVQIEGDVCIHGHASIPRRAASHGCVRVPLVGHNPAKWLYEWIDLGTPIVITSSWPPPPGELVGPPEPETAPASDGAARGTAARQPTPPGG